MYRWDDSVLDTETARLVKVMLMRLNSAEVLGSDDSLRDLRAAAGIDTIADTDTRRFLADALAWCLDKLRDGLTPIEIRDRIRVGNQDTLLKASGVHLLSGHVGKGRQFDWVVVVGAEDGVIPDFRSDTQAKKLEDARVLSVMISRARHGVVVTYAAQIADKYGRVRSKQRSPFYSHLAASPFTDAAGCSTLPRPCGLGSDRE